MIEELRQALRSLLQRPLFLVTTVSMLAVGMGACIAVYAPFDRVWFSPLPLARPDRTITIWASASADRRDRVDYLPADRALGLATETHPVLESAGAYGLVSTDLVVDGVAKTMDGAAVAGSFFAVTGGHAEIGRMFGAMEASARPIVISDRFWRSRYNASASALGRTLSAFGGAWTIVGVASPSSRYPSTADYWIPASGLRDADAPVAWLTIGILAPGTTAQPAADYFHARALADAAEDSTRWGGQGLAVVPVEELPRGAATRPLLVVAGAVGVAMLLCLLTLTNLMATRALQRVPESTVRAALGASRWRLARPFVAEWMIVATLGVGAGLLLAVWGSLAIARALPDLGGDVLGPHTIAFSCVIALLTIACLGAGPALQFAAVDVRNVLNRVARTATGSRRNARLRGLIAGVQVAISVFLIVVLGVSAKAVRNFRELDVGYDAGHMVVIRPDWAAIHYDDRAQSGAADEMLELLRSRGYPHAAAWRTRAPDYPPPPTHEILTIEGRSGDLPVARMLWSYDEVGAGFFDAFRIPILEGRAFSSTDTRGSLPVVIVSKVAAEQWWPGETPIGKRIRLGGERSDEPWLTVIGVTTDFVAVHFLSRAFSLLPRRYPRAYRPAAQAGDDPPPGWNYRRCFYCSRVSVAFRVDGPPEPAARAIRDDLDRSFPQLGTPIVRPLLEEQMDVYGPANLTRSVTFLTPFLVFAAVLSLLGIIGIIGDSVARRRRELGVRMALGASRARIISTILRDAWLPIIGGALAGAVIDVIGVPVTSKVFFLGGFRTILPGTGPADPAVLLPATATVIAFGMAIAVLTARRIAHVQPAAALSDD